MVDKLVIAQGTDASTLDPFAHSETTTANILLQVYDSLVKRDDSMEIVPWLATGWRYENDYTLIMTLRPGVVFHHGEPFNAETVKFSIERMVHPDNQDRFPPSGRFNSMKSVEILDDLTIKIHFNRPDPNILAQLAGLMMIPPKYFAEVGEERFSQEPSGTGPFLFKQWDRENGKVFMEKNRSYWAGEADFSHLEFHAVPHGKDRIERLLNKSIDIAVNFPPLSRDEMNRKEGIRVLGTPSVGIIYMGINTHHEILKNKKVRHAIAHAIDVKKLIEQELDGCGYPLAGPVYPQAFGVNENDEPIAFDPEKSKQLLKEAGYEENIRLKLEVPDGRFAQDKEICLNIAEQLKEVGIDLHVDIQPWGQFIARFRDHQYDQMYYVGWGNFTFDPDEVYRNAFIHPRPWNPTHFHHEDLAKYAIEASLTMDEEKRRSLYEKTYRIFREELPWIPLFQQYDLYGVSDRCHFIPRMDEFIYAFDIKKSQSTGEK